MCVYIYKYIENYEQPENWAVVERVQYTFHALTSRQTFVGSGNVRLRPPLNGKDARGKVYMKTRQNMKFAFQLILSSGPTRYGSRERRTLTYAHMCTKANDMRYNTL